MKFNFKFNLKYLVATILIIVVMLAIVGVGFSYLNYRKTHSTKNTAQENQEVKKLVAEVGKLIDLPTNEEPTVATVSDISKLKDQPFFQKAKNGDKVLIYAQTRKAILYDPSSKKIIDVAPINLGTSSAQVASSSSKPTSK